MLEEGTNDNQTLGSIKIQDLLAIFSFPYLPKPTIYIPIQ